MPIEHGGLHIVSYTVVGKNLALTCKVIYDASRCAGTVGMDAFIRRQEVTSLLANSIWLVSLSSLSSTMLTDRATIWSSLLQAVLWMNTSEFSSAILHLVDTKTDMIQICLKLL